MASHLLLLGGLLAVSSLLSCGAAPSPPVWPESYMVSYTLELPYIATLQPASLKYPVQVWYDAQQSKMRISFYNGLDETIIVPGSTFNLYPRITTQTCMVLNTTSGPTLLAEEEGLPPPLPSLEGWEYAGQSHTSAQPAAHVWQLSQRMQEKVNTYKFSVAQADGRPLLLTMMGVNLFTGSHYDMYQVVFTAFQPLVSARVFKPPILCKHAVSAPRAHLKVAVGQAMSVLPSSLISVLEPQTAPHPVEGGPTASLWQSISAMLKPKGPEVLQPQAAADMEFIKQWNAQSPSQDDRLKGVATRGKAGTTPSFKLSTNHFLHWPVGSWEALMPVSRPLQGAKKRSQSEANLGMFKRRLTDAQLPKSVDWRGTGADGPVKDQASCGSCWAFATSGAMTGAWHVATNQSLSFSEQQIVDCSWDYEMGGGGCFGGWVAPALAYAHAMGGISLESEYAYRGQNGMCRENKTVRSAAAFQGFVNIPEKDEGALMEAVATLGPVAVSFDAVHITFKYYSDGVYYRKDCGQDADHLNHAVTLVGYGTTPEGTDFWLLRNSWSTLWGADGYFKMARKDNDCGVTVDAVAAVVDVNAAMRARTASKQQKVETY